LQVVEQVALRMHALLPRFNICHCRVHESLLNSNPMLNSMI